MVSTTIVPPLLRLGFGGHRVCLQVDLQGVVSQTLQHRTEVRWRPWSTLLRSGCDPVWRKAPRQVWSHVGGWREHVQCSRGELPRGPPDLRTHQVTRAAPEAHQGAALHLAAEPARAHVLR